MFLGTYEHNLLDKDRISLPAKLRSVLEGQRIILRVGLEPCIVGFKESDWMENTKGELSKPFFLDKKGRDERRKIFANAEYAELDSQGRFVLPKAMLLHAGIREKASIIGAGDHFEIWETKIWRDYYKKVRK
ncbi:cell division/cell wall cluster transcriptional repressor MraZ [Candidatus Gottesmanbacteria bacterium]|nr:cell division/cell wall cluster transcriptional repressor MraZ [Candidatus Gottesmanbacteria bacterium]